MKSRRCGPFPIWRCGFFAFSAGLITTFAWVASTHADHIPTDKDVAILRTPLPGEGYLRYKHSPTGGEERTGWTDIRHPAYFDGVGGPQILTTNTGFGYDRSDHNVTVQNIIVTDNSGAPVTPNIARDFDFANQIYQNQLGISVISAGNLLTTNTSVTSPIAPNIGSANLLMAPHPTTFPVINSFYVATISSAFGFAVPPRLVVAGAASNSGIAIRNAPNPDTMAHELGHFLLDSYQFSIGGDPFHSPNADDLMAAGGFRSIPTTDPKGLGNDAPKDPGLFNPTLGTTSHFSALVGLVSGGTFVGGAPTTTQGSAMFSTASDGNQWVQVTDNGATYGNRADFDWVEDSIHLEALGGRADNHPGVDFMVWEIGPTTASAHSGHDHDAWGALNLPDFNGDRFNYVDVVSQIARYADQDVMGGEWSPRNSALDYDIFLSSDGTSWYVPDLVRVFIPGWTLASSADDYVARWVVPQGKPFAKFVRIQAHPYLSAGHDGNAQIDAIIVAFVVPEPSSLCLLLAGGAVLAIPVFNRLRRKSRSEPTVL